MRLVSIFINDLSAEKMRFGSERHTKHRGRRGRGRALGGVRAQYRKTRLSSRRFPLAMLLPRATSSKLLVISLLPFSLPRTALVCLHFGFGANVPSIMRASAGRAHAYVNLPCFTFASLHAHAFAQKQRGPSDRRTQRPSSSHLTEKKPHHFFDRFSRPPRGNTNTHTRALTRS